MLENKDRTEALYTVWRGSRQMVPDDDGVSVVKYYDGAVIVAEHFTVHVGNREFHSSDLRKAEKWLWNNWVRHEKEAGEI